MPKRHLLQSATATAVPCKVLRLSAEEEEGQIEENGGSIPILEPIAAKVFPLLAAWNTINFAEIDKQALEERWFALKEQLENNEFYKEFLRLLLETARSVVPVVSSVEDNDEASVPQEKKKSSRSVTWSPFYEKKTSTYLVHLPYEYTKLKTMRQTDHELVLWAIHKQSLDLHVIRRVPVTRTVELRRVAKSLVMHRCLPHNTVNRPRKIYIKNGFLYSVSESMDSELRDVVEDRTTHHCVAMVMHQLLSLLANMHDNGFSHGDVGFSSTSMNDDITVKVVDYGFLGRNDAAHQWADVEACREILAHFLLEEESCHSLLNGTAEIEQLEWKPILESTEETGLTDANAREFLMEMGAGPSCRNLLEHNYLSCFRPKKQTLLEKLIDMCDENVDPGHDLIEKEIDEPVKIKKLFNSEESVEMRMKKISEAGEEQLLGILEAEIGFFNGEC